MNGAKKKRYKKKILVFSKLNFDFMVGGQLEDFNTMVKLTSDAPLIILEGDEYLSSPLDKKPKFLHYKPDVTLITGIAWDHMNDFPTFKNYILQFKKLINSTNKKGTQRSYLCIEGLPTWRICLIS